MTRGQRASLLRGIYAIVNESTHALEIAGAALEAGVRIVQYRAKRGIVPQTLRALRAATQRFGALLILNDDWRAAGAYACDGVHLGPGDSGFDDLMPIRKAFPEAIVGLSCGNEDELREAGRAGAEYAGVGPVFATDSKEDAGEPLGLDELARLVAISAIPVAAIGGISPANLGGVRRAGASMAAVISAIANAEQPGCAASELVHVWNA